MPGFANAGQGLHCMVFCLYILGIMLNDKNVFHIRYSDTVLTEYLAEYKNLNTLTVTEGLGFV